MAENTAWFVNDQTNENTTAWVSATTVLEAFGGSESRIPGVSTKNNTAVYKNMIMSIIVS